MLVLIFAGFGAGTAPHKFRIADPALAKAVAARGGKLIGDYGAFQIIEADDSALTATEKKRVESADELNVIELNARRLDTRFPEIQALRKPVAAFAGKRLHLVQFAAPVKPEWRAALEKTGARIINYTPENSYLIYGDEIALAKMQSWASNADFVQWDGPYSGDLKISRAARAVNAQGVAREIGTGVFAIQLVADSDTNAATLALIDRLKLAPVQRDWSILRFHNITVALPPDALNQIAAQPDVISIQPYFTPKKHDERQDQIVAGNLTLGSPDQPPGPGYLDWLASKGFTQAQFDASGFVVDVSDSGIDNGTTTPGHFALYRNGNSSDSSRVAYTRLEGTHNPGGTLRGCDGHGTLNTHIIAGYDSAAGPTNNDAQGFSYGLGVCPFVKVGSSVIFDPSQWTNPDENRLQSDAYAGGARISNNSWGASAGGAYDPDAQTYDALVRDAQSFVSGNQEMAIVFVAGNDTNAYSINSPGSAKNVITVGASENVRSLSAGNGGTDSAGDSGCIDDADNAADNADDMTDFSSRGPCADGRMKPDLVAPGTHITGGVAQTSPPPSPLSAGAAISCFNADGVCALSGGGPGGTPADDFFPLGQEFFTVSSGTSHAAPAVSGACALLRQFFINNNQPPPSPAMTKAWLMNSARYLTGAYANDDLWSPGQGMGELNLGAAFDGVPRIFRDELSADKFTATGQTRSFSGVVADPSKPFRVTVAWTDAPGSTPAAAELDNDLDLEVTVGGITYHGNHFSGQFSTPGGTADRRNNVESVFLTAGESGAFTVSVTAANIAADGVPNEAPALDQDFALVIYNVQPAPVPNVVAAGSALVNEDCLPTNGVIDSGETVTVSFALQNIGSVDTANLVATLLATNGIALPGAPQSYGALTAGGPAVAQPFAFTAAASCGDTITATFHLQDDGADLGLVTFPFTLGTYGPVFAQNFDSATAPGLPAGWTSSADGGQKPWTTSKAAAASPPNSEFSAAPASIGVNALVSPDIVLPGGPAQLAFQNNYNLEASGGVDYDGAVLEIKIGAGVFQDILDAGGSFESGGYTGVVSANFGNPLAARRCWSGNSGGFITTVVDLPPAAQGQTIRLQWRCGTDSSRTSAGWFIDSVVINSRVCCPDELPPLPFSPAAASYSGLFFESNSVQLGSSGAFAATTTGSGAYSGTLQTASGRFSFRGQLDPASGAATNTFPQRNSTALTLKFQVSGANNERITGTVGDNATWTADLTAYRAASSTHSPFAGQYTMIFPGTNSGANLPHGDGFASLTVNSQGGVRLKGSLADGTTISDSALVSADGRWPLYVPLYGGSGQILGWLDFSTNRAAEDFGGAVEWQKNSSAGGRFYPEGFDFRTRATGSEYNPSARPILNFNSLILSGGNLALTNPVSVSANNKVSDLGGDGLKFGFKTLTGRFQGGVANPATGKSIPFSGVVLQKQEYGAGYFPSTNRTAGEVLLAP